MCFTKIVKEIEQPLVAEEDIECFKYLTESNGTVSPPYRAHVYQFDKKNEEIVLVPLFETSSSNCQKYIKVNKGYHSFITTGDAKMGMIGAEMAMRNEENPFDRWYELYRCIIPKGSSYFKNKEEYVSSNIIIKNETTW